MGISYEDKTTSSGVVKHRCVVKKSKNGKVVFRKSKTFTSLDLAKEWGEKTYSELSSQLISLAALIDLYLKAKKDIGRSKKATLIKFASSSFGQILVSEFSANKIQEYCRFRLSEGVKPQTVNHDISSIRSVFREAEDLLGMCVDDGEFKKTINALRESDLISESDSIELTISKNHLQEIRQVLSDRESHHANTIPFNAFVTLMLELGVKTSELCRITWNDFDPSKKLLRCAQWKYSFKTNIHLTDSAIDVLSKQPRNGDLIFPYNSKCVSEGFGRACSSLGYTQYAMRFLINNWKASQEAL
ncbi:tyrosine-type recombinase/integrase [Vibrio vulnificus]|nr:tyrosine-type recombinase/integrase [Vibrio vulnificus]